MRFEAPERSTHFELTILKYFDEIDERMKFGRQLYNRGRDVVVKLDSRYLKIDVTCEREMPRNMYGACTRLRPPSIIASSVVSEDLLLVILDRGLVMYFQSTAWVARKPSFSHQV